MKDKSFYPSIETLAPWKTVQTPGSQKTLARNSLFFTPREEISTRDETLKPNYFKGRVAK